MATDAALAKELEGCMSTLQGCIEERNQLRTENHDLQARLKALLSQSAETAEEMARLHLANQALGEQSRALEDKVRALESYGAPAALAPEHQLHELGEKVRALESKGAADALEVKRLQSDNQSLAAKVAEASEAAGVATTTSTPPLPPQQLEPSSQRWVTELSSILAMENLLVQKEAENSVLRRRAGADSPVGARAQLPSAATQQLELELLYESSGEPCHATTVGELEDLCASGALTLLTRVWVKGLANWMREYGSSPQHLCAASRGRISNGLTN